MVLYMHRRPRPVVAALTPYRHRLDVVDVDAAGIGYYLAKHLQDLGYPVRPLNVRDGKVDPMRAASGARTGHFTRIRERSLSQSETGRV